MKCLGLVKVVRRQKFQTQYKVPKAAVTVSTNLSILSISIYFSILFIIVIATFIVISFILIISSSNSSKVFGGETPRSHTFCWSTRRRARLMSPAPVKAKTLLFLDMWLPAVVVQFLAALIFCFSTSKEFKLVVRLKGQSCSEA